MGEPELSQILLGGQMDEKFTVDADEDVVLTLMSHCLFSTELKVLYKNEGLQMGPTL